MAVVMPVSIPGMKKTLAGWLVSEKIVLLRANKYSPIMDDYYAETINS